MNPNSSVKRLWWILDISTGTKVDFLKCEDKYGKEFRCLGVPILRVNTVARVKTESCINIFSHFFMKGYVVGIH